MPASSSRHCSARTCSASCARRSRIGVRANIGPDANSNVGAATCPAGSAAAGSGPDSDSAIGIDARIDTGIGVNVSAAFGSCVDIDIDMNAGTDAGAGLSTGPDIDPAAAAARTAGAPRNSSGLESTMIRSHKSGRHRPAHNPNHNLTCSRMQGNPPPPGPNTPPNIHPSIHHSDAPVQRPIESAAQTTGEHGPPARLHRQGRPHFQRTWWATGLTQVCHPPHPPSCPRAGHALAGPAHDCPRLGARIPDTHRSHCRSGCTRSPDRLHLCAESGSNASTG